MYNTQCICGKWFGVRLSDNRKFIKDLLKSNKGWWLFWFIIVSNYDMVCPELGLTPTQFVPYGMLLICAHLILLQTLFSLVFFLTFFLVIFLGSPLKESEVHL